MSIGAGELKYLFGAEPGKHLRKEDGLESFSIPGKDLWCIN